MYYNTNKNSNDYYSAYKEEISNPSKTPEHSPLKRVKKLLLITLFLGALAFGQLYFFNYFSTNIPDSNPKVVSNITAEQTTQLKNSVTQTPIETKQLTSNREATPNSNIHTINPKDIELIVKIIMSQMNQAPKENLHISTHKTSLEEQLLAAEEKVSVKQTLKEGNHYNKVIVSSHETPTDRSNELMQLQHSLNDAIEESNEQRESSDYSKAITKEVVVRSNEMRIIIVQRGDSLSKIAEKAYGNREDYIKILNANPEVVKNPDEIFVGQPLRIPL